MTVSSEDADEAEQEDDEVCGHLSLNIYMNIASF